MLIVGILFFFKYSKKYAFKSNRAFDIHHKRGSLQKGAYHFLPAEGGSSSLSRTSLKIQDRASVLRKKILDRPLNNENFKRPTHTHTPKASDPKDLICFCQNVSNELFYQLGQQQHKHI